MIRRNFPSNWLLIYNNECVATTSLLESDVSMVVFLFKRACLRHFLIISKLTVRYYALFTNTQSPQSQLNSFNLQLHRASQIHTYFGSWLGMLNFKSEKNSFHTNYRIIRCNFSTQSIFSKKNTGQRNFLG